MEGKKEKKYSTQRVDIETVTLIKTLNLHLIQRGINMRQSDLINAAFKYVKSREWEFIEFIESNKVEDDEGIMKTVSRVVSKPWFPVGEFGG